MSRAAPTARAEELRAALQRGRTALRQRRGRLFFLLTLIPVIVALAFVALLLAKVLTDAVSWQVVEPANSGQTFPFGAAPAGGEAVIRLELLAQGLSPAEVDAYLADPEKMRLFNARNRVELMILTDDGPWRWVVTNARDRRVTDVPLLEGWSRRSELFEGLQPGQKLYLNPWLDLSFFSKVASRTPVMAGLRTALAGTLWVIALVALIAVPLGVGAAIYLEEYAREGRLSRFIEVNVRNLAGVPSIVYGILGLYVFVRLARLGPTVLAAALTLALLTLPVIIIAGREAIRAVPDSLRQASYGLGATKWQTVRHVVLPSAVPGIVTGVVLALARALGETAPLLLVGAAAFVAFVPEGPLSPYTVIPVQIYSWVAENEPEFFHVAAAGILTLLMVLVLLYALAFVLRRRFAVER